jgi:hypothetical protein
MQKVAIDEPKFVETPPRKRKNSMNLEEDFTTAQLTVDRSFSKSDWINALKKYRVIGIRIVCTGLSVV